MVIRYLESTGEPRAMSEVAFTVHTPTKLHFDLEPEYDKNINWDWLLEHWVKRSKRRLRDLTILVMRESCGMNLSTIGQLFDLHKGTVSRIATNARKDIHKLIMGMVNEKDLE